MYVNGVISTHVCVQYKHNLDTHEIITGKIYINIHNYMAQRPHKLSFQCLHLYMGFYIRLIC